jgi:hypothetical protein
MPEPDTVVEEQVTARAGCPNCGTPVTGQYCSHCGQRFAEVRISMRRILMDVLEDQLSLNAALPRTMRALFFKPGFLTAEYLKLRIARYIPPFRLYLFSSLLFFITLSIMASTDNLNVQAQMQADSADLAAIEADTALARQAAECPKFGVHLDPRRLQSTDWAQGVCVNFGIPYVNQAIETRLAELGTLPPRVAMRQIGSELIEQSPKAAFLLLPVYALILKFLYARRKRYYVEHFIFALHVHAFAFLVFFLVLLIPERGAPVEGLLLLSLPVYIWLALKRVYAQGWLRTTLKWLLLGWLYLVLLVFAAFFTFAAAVFTA